MDHALKWVCPGKDVALEIRKLLLEARRASHGLWIQGGALQTPPWPRILPAYSHRQRFFSPPPILVPSFLKRTNIFAVRVDRLIKRRRGLFRIPWFLSLSPFFSFFLPTRALSFSSRGFRIDNPFVRVLLPSFINSLIVPPVIRFTDPKIPGGSDREGFLEGICFPPRRGKVASFNHRDF